MLLSAPFTQTGRMTPTPPSRLAFSAPASAFPVGAWLRYFPSDLTRRVPPRAACTFPLERIAALADFPGLPADSPLRVHLRALGLRADAGVGELVPWSVTGYPAPSAGSLAAESPTDGGHRFDGGGGGGEDEGQNGRGGQRASDAAPRRPRHRPHQPPPGPPPHPQAAPLPQFRGASPSPPLSRGQLTLHAYLYSGHVFDVYAGFLGAAPVLVKLTDVRAFQPAELPALLATVDRELSLGAGLGAQRLAPALLGMYAAVQPDRGQVMCLVFAGARELTRPERHDAALHGRVLGAYRRLHEQGVAHGSTGWRHMRMQGDDVLLFDFEFAAERANAAEGEWESTREEEMRHVKTLLRWK